MRRRYLAIGAALISLSAGCSSGHHAATPSTTSPTVSLPNPDVVPADITPAYVDAVFRVLNHVSGNAVRNLVEGGSVTPSVRSALRTIYDDPLYAQELKIAQQSIQGGLSNVKKPPGDVHTTVTRLIAATSQCIFVETTDDYSAVLIKPGPPPASGYWGLKPKQPGSDPLGLNSTQWAFFFNAVYVTPTNVPDQCA